MRSLLSWKRLTQLGPFRWGNAAPRRAGRVALGVVAPLVVGWAAGRVDYGGYAALGALPAGFVSFQGESRTRVTALCVASVGMAISTFVGAVTAAASPWLLVAVIALWGYLTGLAVSLGQRYSVAVLQCSIALLIAIGLPFGASDAALRAALVLAGGLLQAVLVAASWTLSPGSTERSALAVSYRALAIYASGLATGALEPPPPTAFPAGTALDDPNPLLPAAVRLALADLLEEAERIRASLAALAVHAADGESLEPEGIRGALMPGVARMLNLIADALAATGAERTSLIGYLSGGISQSEIPASASWRWAGEALLGQLRAVESIVATLEGGAASQARTGGPSVRSRGWWQGSVGAVVATLRANATTRSEAGRHALRLAAIAAFAEVAVQVTGLYQGRWVILTIFVVLKPDYGSTLFRGVQRGLGTMLGAGLGGAAARLLHIGEGGLIAIGGAFVAAAYALFDVSYLLFSVFVTGFIVVLLDLLGSPVIRSVEARLLDTFIGAVLALAAYLAWPTWEGRSAQEKFARLIQAHRAYAAALFDQLIHSRPMASELRALQGGARIARSDAEAATARLREEPAHVPLTPEFAQTLMAAVTRFALAELALHALILSRRGPQGPANALTGPIDVFASALDTTLDQLARAVLRLQHPAPIPALRPLQAALHIEARSADPALFGITDRMVDAADTLDAMLRSRLAAKHINSSEAAQDMH